MDGCHFPKPTDQQNELLLDVPLTPPSPHLEWGSDSPIVEAKAFRPLSGPVEGQEGQLLVPQGQGSHSVLIQGLEEGNTSESPNEYPWTLAECYDDLAEGIWQVQENVQEQIAHEAEVFRNDLSQAIVDLKMDVQAEIQKYAFVVPQLEEKFNVGIAFLEEDVE